MAFPSIRRFVVAALAALFLTGQAIATWSIVVVDLATGEICVACATCIENFNLRSAVGIMAEEAGAGASQSYGAPLTTRVLINDLLLAGVPPDEILAQIESFDPQYQMRQFGIVDLAGRAAAHTGTGDGAWAGHVTGRVGTLVYSIQGNVLTGSPVVAEAEQALINTQGDMSQRVMAAMEAAQAMGGDGRCSCNPQDPEACGSPPANFTKSAHVGFFIIGRPGDNPYCTGFGCAAGDLYLAINKAGLVAADPDPVFEIRIKYDEWRTDLIGRPDGNLSSVFAYSNETNPGATTPLSFVIDLADVDGTMLTAGGATISMEHDPTSAGLATLHQVTDHNDGTYTVEVMPGNGAGLDQLRFIVDDGIRPVTLWPPTRLLHRAPAPTPLTSGKVISGLSGFQDLQSAFPLADGHRAWVLANRGSGQELLRYTRPNLGSPFALDLDFGIANFAMNNLRDLWMSDDELRMTFSAYMPADGSRRLFSTTRFTTLDDFDEPTLLVDLDSDFEEGGPWLSENEMEIWFHSTRDGQSDIWHAKRLNREARWFPPTKVESVSTGGQERYPMLSAGSTRMWLTRRSIGESLLQVAERNPDGSFEATATAAGSFSSPTAAAVAIGMTLDPLGNAPSLWHLGGDSPANKQLMVSHMPATSLTVTPDSLSESTGGVFQFNLTAGLPFANGGYTLLVGSPSAGGYLDGVGTLPITQTLGLTGRIRSLYNSPELAGGSGSLDAAGVATVSWTVPAGAGLPAGLIDRDLGVCFVAQKAGDHFISEAVVVRITP
ncbi:MAG: DUF1028 domain-containing protein [Planctomycetes bacterium]|nr:DUF1028 domain-containing protein [Planctomycetota bacterium]MCP4771877.1 DUF1028 domain-containing protein [Planctomycetota bacterium]MCP4861887.1 DUF1028 domain-containing protein [Planctomycetota bacterium]